MSTDLMENANNFNGFVIRKKILQFLFCGDKLSDTHCGLFFF